MIDILNSVKCRVTYGRDALEDCLSIVESNNVVVCSFHVQHSVFDHHFHDCPTTLTIITSLYKFILINHAVTNQVFKQ